MTPGPDAAAVPEVLKIYWADTSAKTKTKRNPCNVPLRRGSNVSPVQPQQPVHWLLPDPMGFAPRKFFDLLAFICLLPWSLSQLSCEQHTVFTKVLENVSFLIPLNHKILMILFLFSCLITSTGSWHFLGSRSPEPSLQRPVTRPPPVVSSWEEEHKNSAQLLINPQNCHHEQQLKILAAYTELDRLRLINARVSVLTNFHPDFETEELKKGYLRSNVPNAAELRLPAVCSAEAPCMAAVPVDGARTASAPRWDEFSQFIWAMEQCKRPAILHPLTALSSC